MGRSWEEAEEQAAPGSRGPSATMRPTGALEERLRQARELTQEAEEDTDRNAKRAAVAVGAGAAVAMGGLWWAWPPLALIVFGVALMAVGVVWGGVVAAKATAAMRVKEKLNELQQAMEQEQAKRN